MSRILLDLYRISVEEYRFQVLHNWGRNRFYLLLSGGLGFAGIGSLRVSDSSRYEILAIPLFVVGCLVAFVGLQVLKKGQEYYRSTILKMSSLEKQLNLQPQEIPIATTQGQKESKLNLVDSALCTAKTFRIGTANYWLAMLFVLEMSVNVLGILFVAFELIY